MSEEDGYDILYRKYKEGSALVKKYRQKFTALRTENEMLKSGEEYRMMQERLVRLIEGGKKIKAENERLKDELSAIAEAHKQVMSEQCAPDEKHCTCVPVLRAEINRLKEDKRELVEAMASIAMITHEKATRTVAHAAVAKHREK